MLKSAIGSYGALDRIINRNLEADRVQGRAIRKLDDPI